MRYIVNAFRREYYQIPVIAASEDEAIDKANDLMNQNHKPYYDDEVWEFKAIPHDLMALKLSEQSI